MKKLTIGFKRHAVFICKDVDLTAKIKEILLDQFKNQLEKGTVRLDESINGFNEPLLVVEDTRKTLILTSVIDLTDD